MLVTVTAPALSVSANSVTDNSYIRGDANSDGEVTILDTTEIREQHHLVLFFRLVPVDEARLHLRLGG